MQVNTRWWINLCFSETYKAKLKLFDIEMLLFGYLYSLQMQYVMIFIENTKMYL